MSAVKMFAFRNRQYMYDSGGKQHAITNRNGTVILEISNWLVFVDAERKKKSLTVDVGKKRGKNGMLLEAQ